MALSDSSELRPLAFLYMRVSTRQQADSGLGLGAQRSQLRALCKVLGLEVVEEFVDAGESTERPMHKRPEGARLLEELRRADRRADLVLAARPCRLERNLKAALELIDELVTLEPKVGLVLADMGGQPLAMHDSFGRLILNVLFSFGEFTRAQIRENTVRALRERVRRGLPSSGTPKYGYKLECVKGCRGKFLPCRSKGTSACGRCGGRARQGFDHDEMATIGWIVEGWLEGLSYGKIAKELAANKRVRRSGKGWQRNRVQEVAARVQKEPETVAQAIESLAWVRGYGFDPETEARLGEFFAGGPSPAMVAAEARRKMRHRVGLRKT